MAPNPRIALACRSMKKLGVSEAKVKPVLRRLRKLYDDNWKLIEEENYRVLADAIFDEEDNNNKPKDEGSACDEHVGPLTRSRKRAREISSRRNGSPDAHAGTISGKSLQLRYEGSEEEGSDEYVQPLIRRSRKHDRASCSYGNGSSIEAGTALIQPEVDEAKMTLATLQQQPLRCYFRRRRKLLPAPSGPISTQPVSAEEPMPLAVIHPEKEMAQLICGTPETRDADEIVGTVASASATVLDETPSSLEIASSTSGHVKISLSCNTSALGTQNLQLHSIDKLREMMEQRFLRSYKLMGPNFDIIRILNDVCECISDLVTNSSNQAQEGDVMPDLDASKRSLATEALDAESNLAGLSSRSSNGQHSSNGCIDNGVGKELAVLPQHEPSLDKLRWLHYKGDISKGKENVEIPWNNEINKDFPPPLQYISESLVFHNARVNFSLYRARGCHTCSEDCLSEQSHGCACQAEKKNAYYSTGVLMEDFLEVCISVTRDPQQQRLLHCTNCPLEKNDPPRPCKGHLKRKVIKECWRKCGCNKQCGNRVVQRGLNHKLQVFLTPDEKGWGLRTLEKIPKGAFVCKFVGEVLTISELYARNKEKHTCPVLLDAHWALKEVCEDEEALCLDATDYGNVARFINHRCLDANLIEIPIEVETPDLHYYHLGLFTTREVNALEELTWDYGIDFDDLEHPVKAFQCRCGSKFCRNAKRSTE